MTRHHPRRVAPFGDPRIGARRRLPAAFRSRPRPSSAPGAQASPARSVPLGAPPPGAPSRLLRSFPSTTLRLLKKGAGDLWLIAHVGPSAPNQESTTAAGQKNRPDIHQAALQSPAFWISMLWACPALRVRQRENRSLLARGRLLSAKTKYTPKALRPQHAQPREFRVEMGGFEPSTSRVQGGRSPN